MHILPLALLILLIHRGVILWKTLPYTTLSSPIASPSLPILIAFLSFLTVFPSKRDTPSRSWIPIQQPKRGCFRANWFPTEDPLVPLLPNPIPLSVCSVNGMIME